MAPIESGIFLFDLKTLLNFLVFEITLEKKHMIEVLEFRVSIVWDRKNDRMNHKS